MENNYLEKYLKYKDKYLQSRNLNKNGGGFLTEDNSINSMICKISSTHSLTNPFILVSFKNGFIYNYHEEKCYLILKKKQKDEFYLFGIRNINECKTSLTMNYDETFKSDYETKNIQILHLLKFKMPILNFNLIIKIMFYNFYISLFWMFF